MTATAGFKYRRGNVHDKLGTSQKGYRDRRTVRYSSRLLFNLSESCSRRSALATTESEL